jgi:hypothetical protein
MKKICKKCKQKLEKEMFYSNKRTKDGLYFYCKKCHYNQTRKWISKNNKKVNQYAGKWRDNNRPKLKEYRVKTYEHRKEWMIEYRTKWRDKVLNHLGNKCKKCGYSDKRALQIDHINGGGYEDRKDLIVGFYKKVIEDKSNKYQLLCANCNWIKKNENGEVRKNYKLIK